MMLSLANVLRARASIVFSSSNRFNSRYSTASNWFFDRVRSVLPFKKGAKRLEDESLKQQTRGQSPSNGPISVASPWEVAKVAAASKHTAKRLKPFWVTIPHHRCSPRKLRLIALAISGLNIEEAIIQARFMTKRAAIKVYHTLCQARALIRNQAYPHDFFDPSPLINGEDKKNDLTRKKPEPTPEMEAKAKELLSRYTVLQAVVGRGTYLKRLDIKGRGRHGIRRRPHAMMRIQLGVLDEQRRIEKLLKQTVILQEDKPVYAKRLSY